MPAIPSKISNSDFLNINIYPNPNPKHVFWVKSTGVQWSPYGLWGGLQSTEKIRKSSNSGGNCSRNFRKELIPGILGMEWDWKGHCFQAEFKNVILHNVRSYTSFGSVFWAEFENAIYYVIQWCYTTFCSVFQAESENVTYVVIWYIIL